MITLGEMFKRKDNYQCPFCGKDTRQAEFRDARSQREFEISGLCQKCQDETFKEDEE